MDPLNKSPSYRTIFKWHHPTKAVAGTRGISMHKIVLAAAAALMIAFASAGAAPIS
jgi:hypothetical protein